MRRLSIVLISLLAVPAHAYDLKNLSKQDLLTLGAGLDELPRKMGDANGLWGRLQQQIIEQDAKAAADAEAAIRQKIEAENKK